MKVTNIPLLIPLLLLLALLGCQNDGPIAPGGADTPPAWVSTIGVVSVVSGEAVVTVYWGEAVDFQDPPVEYLVYEDVDENPFDQSPVLSDSNDPYTFSNLAIGTEYWFGVRVRDSAQPPHVDGNTKALSARTADRGWARTWGGPESDFGKSVAMDGSGNTYVSGGLNWTAFLSKYDSNGNLLWALNWDAGPVSLAIDALGDVYVTGTFHGSVVDLDPGPGVDDHAGVDGHMFLSKFDPDGNFLWARNWGGEGTDYPASIATDSSGNVCVTGVFQLTVDFDPGPGVDYHTSDPELPIDNVFVSKFDPGGNFLWARTWGDSEFNVAFSVAIDQAGSVYTTGWTMGTTDFDPGPGVDNHYSFGSSAFLSKLDSNGSFLWARTWDQFIVKYGTSVTVDGPGNAYVAGVFEDTADLDPGPGIDSRTSNGANDVFLAIFDSSGNFLSALTCGGPINDSVSAVAVDYTGNTYIAGSFEDTVDFDPGPGVDNHISNGGHDAFLSKFDPNGDFLWARTWGSDFVDAWGYDFEYGNSVAVDAWGNACVTGKFGNTIDFCPGPGVDNHASNGDWDVFLIKLLPDGTW